MTTKRNGAIAGLVLMGGRGTRMGGADKALLVLADGRPILAHALERLRGQVGPLALSANGDPARLAGFGLTVLPDPADGPEGPLGGVRAGLRWAASLGSVSHLATVPGDAPAPPRDLVARLAAAAGDGAAAASGPDGVEPLHALWPVASLAALDELIAGGVQSPKRALARLGAVEVGFAERFRDVDTPDDLAALKATFRGA
jgi:molybdopterin-guanine dinucleotide biosynthesis protein A